MPQIQLKDERPLTDETGPLERRKGEARTDLGERQQTKRAGIRWRRVLAVAAFAVVVVLAAAGGAIWWLDARQYESTDDAYIDARSVSISSQLAGAIVNVPVTDNALVDTGALLVQIDPRDFEDSVAQAQAQLAQAKASIANLDAQVAAQNARIDQAEKQESQANAALTYAQQENNRNQDLMRRNAGTAQQAQQASSNLLQAEANLGSAQANVGVQQRQVAVIETQRQGIVAQVAQAEAGLTQAQITLARARIVAPEPGRATKISAAVGAIAQPGQVLMIFVPERKWVTANYKETQLTLLRPGLPADITIDAYPGHTFRGHIDSIQAGSGAAFSLLPPENATGNFVKVVQRVPVKIVFDAVPDVFIGPGMSVVPRVKVR
jgi:membrane fusion protein (multidrug efflux system)